MGEGDFQTARSSLSSDDAIPIAVRVFPLREDQAGSTSADNSELIRAAKSRWWESFRERRCFSAFVVFFFFGWVLAGHLWLNLSQIDRFDDPDLFYSAGLAQFMVIETTSASNSWNVTTTELSALIGDGNVSRISCTATVSRVMNVRCESLGPWSSRSTQNWDAIRAAASNCRVVMMFEMEVIVGSAENFTADEVLAPLWTYFSNNMSSLGYGTIVADNWNTSVGTKAPTAEFGKHKYNALHCWFTFWVLFFTVLVLMQDGVIEPDVALAGSVCLLLVAGVISTSESLKGFANDGVATVGMLFVVSRALQNTGVLDLVPKYVFGNSTSRIVALFRLCFPVALLSAFVNNAAMVAMLIPVVQRWCKKCGFSASQFLMPLSFSTILGGTLSLIGTTTNLVVTALWYARVPGLPTLGLFEITKLSLPVSVVGLFYVVLTARFIPKRGGNSMTVVEKPREYVASCRIAPGGRLSGRTVAEAGLLHVQGLSLFQIVRKVRRDSEGEVEGSENDVVVSAPKEEDVLCDNDILFFGGSVECVSYLFEIDGIVPADSQPDKVSLPRRFGHRLMPPLSRHHVVEVVLASHSPLIGKSPRTLLFRNKYDAAIIAMHRHGRRVATPIADSVLQSGDALLLEAGPSFLARYQFSEHFALVAPLGASTRLQHGHWALMVGSIVVMAAMIAVPSIPGVTVTLFATALFASFLFWMMGFLSVDDARTSVRMPAIVLIAFGVGLSTAIESSGLSVVLAWAVADLFYPLGDIGILAGLFIVTVILNMVIGNAASVSIMWPIGYRIAIGSGNSISVPTISYMMMMAGSADFSTPIGEQANLMVYGAGGYKFADFLKVGFPLQVICAFIAVPLSYVIYKE